MYARIIRPALFRTSDDPEVAHEFVLRTLEQFQRVPLLPRLVEQHQTVTSPRLQQTICGMTFRNPVGLAAGMDKNGRCLRAWQALGFGFVEMGTVTCHPQEGNPRPRMMRIPENLALRNWLGFNNLGSERVAELLPLHTDGLSVPLGINVGKSLKVPMEDVEAVLADYATTIERLTHFATYLVVNVSSPNTPGLRLLGSDRDRLRGLLDHIGQTLHYRAVQDGSVKVKPVFLKISPDLTDGEVVDICEVWQAVGLYGGIIATNTTTSTSGLSREVPSKGGTSGEPLRHRACQVVSIVRDELPSVPIIGVGGIATAQHAFEMIAAGASLVQILTGLVYKGPNLPYQINTELLKIMDAFGINQVGDIYHANR